MPSRKARERDARRVRAALMESTCLRIEMPLLGTINNYKTMHYGHLAQIMVWDDPAA